MSTNDVLGLLSGNGFGLGRILRLLSKGLFRQKYSGGAYVIDGDSIRVNDESIRLLGVDAPEIGQMGQSPDGRWYDQGEHVKVQLIRLIGGKQVRVEVIAKDKYRRTVAVVTYNGLDIGEWLVSNGYAIAAYDKRYRGTERQARRRRVGIWGDAVSYNPQDWRNNRDSMRTL